MGTLLLTLLVIGQVEADAVPPEQDDPVETSELRKYINESTTWFPIYTPESEEPVETRSVLWWTSPTRPASPQGLVLFHIHAGRPVAVTSIFPGGDRWLVHEFDSLSRGPIEARENGVPFWHPSRGREFRPVPDAPVPADSRPARLRQMKVIARDFGSTLLGLKEDNSDRETLRQMPQPLFRYDPPEDSDVLDGMAISFALGTDPESMLLLEAFKVEDRYEWQYCFVRQTVGALNGTFRDEVVWTFEKFPPSKDPERHNFALAKSLSEAVIREITGDQ